MRLREDGIYMRPDGRMMEYKGKSHRYFWNPNMINFLKKNYANTKNEELAEILEMGVATIRRKARELGLNKSKEFISKEAK